MDRRRLLVHGAALLSGVLAGCAGPSPATEGTATNHSTTPGGNTTADAPTATATEMRGTTTGTQTTITTGENHETYLLQNLGSGTREPTVTVTPRSGEQQPLVDAFTEEGSGLPTRADAIGPDADWRTN